VALLNNERDHTGILKVDTVSYQVDLEKLMSNTFYSLCLEIKASTIEQCKHIIQIRVIYFC
jgi:hypothetical protein